MVGIVVLIAFLAIGLFGLLMAAVVIRGLDEYEKRYLSRNTATLGEMFIFIDQRQLLLLTLSITVIFAIVGYVVFHWFVALILVVFGMLLPSLIIKKLRKKRLRTFDKQLVDALVQMSSAFRAGLSFPQAAEAVALEMPAPLGDEFKLMIRELRLGVSQEDALINLANRVESDSLHLVVTASNIARQLGGNIAEMYDIISQTVRERFQIEGRIAALTSMGQMQAWVVGAMPLVLGVVFYFMRPDLMEPMLAHTFGKALIVCVLVMEFLGYLLLRRIMDIDV